MGTLRLYNKKPYYLGLHETEFEAAEVYDEAAARLHGEFARLNFPNGGSFVLYK